MTYAIKPLVEPEVKVSGDKRLIDVPKAKALEAISLWERTKADGFFFNGYLGCDVETFGQVLASASPAVVGLSGIADFGYEPIYRSRGIEKLILGKDIPWPDFGRIPRITSFTALAFDGSPEEMPANMRELDLMGVPYRDLSIFGRFQGLRRLRLSKATRLQSLDGIPSSVEDLELLHCPRLDNLESTKSCSLRRLILDHCRKVDSIGFLMGQERLQYLLLSDLGKVPTISFVKHLPKLSFFSLTRVEVSDGDYSAAGALH